MRPTLRPRRTAPKHRQIVAALAGLLVVSGVASPVVGEAPPIVETAAFHSRPRLTCNCPGCRSYAEACGLPCPGEQWELDGESVLPSSPEVAEPSTGAPEPETAPLDGAEITGPLPSSSSYLTAMAGGISATPHMIGDFFGFSGGSSNVVLDQLFVVASDIDAIVMTPDASPFTASESPSAVAVAEGFDASGVAITPTGVITVQPADAEFTTTATTADVRTTLQSNPGAALPIVNNAGYQTLAETALAQRNGAGGTTQFAADQSFARMQDTALPSGGPGQGEDYDAVYAYQSIITLPIDSLGGAPGANVGRQKLAENGSPIPRDRLIDSFSFFKNTPLQARGQDVTRNVVGVEKTFFDEMTSLELRVPFAATLDNNVTLGSTGAVGGTTGEFGNMTLYAKLLLLEQRRYALGAGLGIAMPTADHFVIRDAAGADVLRVENESAHLLPYLGVVLTPNSDLFVQGNLQVDVDTRGNGTSVSPFVNGAYTGDLEFVDRLRDRDLLYVDLSVGYWWYKDPRASCVTGIAPIAELHYNGSIGDGDSLVTDTLRADGGRSVDVLNAVFGTIVQFGGSTTLNLAYATPLGGDEQFDGEFRMSLNWFFGPSASRFANYAF